MAEGWMNCTHMAIRSFDSDLKRLRALASTGVRVRGQIRVSPYGQRNAVDLARGGCVPAGTSPAPRSASAGLWTEIHYRGWRTHCDAGLFYPASVHIDVRNDCCRRATDRQGNRRARCQTAGSSVDRHSNSSSGGGTARGECQYACSGRRVSAEGRRYATGQAGRSQRYTAGESILA